MIYLLAARFVGGRHAFVVVLALELANEAGDFWRYRLSGWPWTPWGTLADLLNTLLWPVVLTALGYRASRATSS